MARTERWERSISLVRQRWSSKSRGPTKDSTLTVSPAGSATAVASRRLMPALPPLPPAPSSRLELHRGAHLGHRLHRHPARALGALVEDLDDLLRLLGEAPSPLPDQGERRHHVLEQHALAVQASDGGGAAA